MDHLEKILPLGRIGFTGRGKARNRRSEQIHRHRIAVVGTLRDAFEFRRRVRPVPGHARISRLRPGFLTASTAGFPEGCRHHGPFRTTAKAYNGHFRRIFC